MGLWDTVKSGGSTALNYGTFGAYGMLSDAMSDAPVDANGGQVAPGTGQYNGPLDEWKAKEDAAQNRAAPKTDFAMANADYQRSLEARGMQMDAAGQYKNVLAGNYNSLAQQQLKEGQQRAVQAGQNLAASARGGGGAQIMAAQAAQRQAALGSQQTNADASMLRAKEEENARQGLAAMAGQIRQGDFASRQGSQGQAQFLTEAELKQRQMNDQMSGQYLGAQSAGYGQQMQGGIAAQQIQAGRDLAALHENQETQRANVGSKRGFVAGLAGGGMGLAGKAAGV